MDLNAVQAAKILGIKVTVFRNLIQRGELKLTRTIKRGVVKFNKLEVQNYASNKIV